MACGGPFFNTQTTLTIRNAMRPLRWEMQLRPGKPGKVGPGRGGAGHGNISITVLQAVLRSAAADRC